MLKYFFLVLILSTLFLQLVAQDSIPKNYFRPPVNIPLFLAGNFGELRPNHFHSGIDIKTQGKQGLNVYATADGFISRIKISPWGYGNVLYIDHPNGYTTVYAHLKKFKGKIAAAVKKYQYKHKSWEIDWYPSDTLLPVKKGDIIALSGNTGGSTAPHLHFEIRETKSEFPVNPLLFGFNIKDNIKPTIKSIAVFPLNDTSFVNGKNILQRFFVVGFNGVYHLKLTTPIRVYGEIGVGIETIDRLNGMPNRNGIYTIQLTKNNEIIYRSAMKKFSFDNVRAVNSLIAYKYYLKKKIRFQRSYVAPNNKLSIYKKVKNHGIIDAALKNKIPLKYVVTDSYGNKSVLNFALTGASVIPKTKIIKTKIDTVFSYLDSNYFKSKNVAVSIPKNALFDNLAFQFSVGATIKGALTPLYKIHNDFTPLAKPITVAIKVGRLSERLRAKATIVAFDYKNRYYARGGTWRNNTLITSAKTFGNYTVMLDTIPPTIKPLNIFNNKNMAKNTEIAVKIADNLSGIKSYVGTIDGNWILMQYEAKKAKLFYLFDNITKGKHIFELILTDAVGNETKVSIPFTR